jgi:tRNA nucleotidyltransferase (CCA-adding enzyme)
MPKEQCYGVIVVLKTENKFLILEREGTKGDWTFAKGHTEEGETPLDTAMRELEEEAGIAEIEITNSPLIHEEYGIIVDGEKRIKMNDYFIGFVEKDDVIIEKSEIQSYKWATYEEAYNAFKYIPRKETIAKAQAYLDEDGSKNMLK